MDRRRDHDFENLKYVDDLSLAGRADLHTGFWDSLRKHIKLDPDTKIEDGVRVLADITPFIAVQLRRPLHFDMHALNADEDVDLLVKGQLPKSAPVYT